MCETELQNLWGCHHLSHSLKRWSHWSTECQAVPDIPSILIEMNRDWDLSISFVTWARKHECHPNTLLVFSSERRHTQTTDMPSDLIWPIFVLQWIWIWDEFHTRSKWSYDLWPTWRTGKKLKESHSHRITTVCKEGSAKLAAKPILVQGEECQLTLFRNTGLYDRYVKQGRRWSLVLVSRWQCVGLTGMKAPFSLLITWSKALTGTSSDTVICVIHDSHTL